MSAPGEAAVPAVRHSRLGFWSFIAFMALLTVIFAALGFWQLERLQEKEALIASVDQRMHLPPLAMPPMTEWVGLDPEVYNFRPVTLTGHFSSDGSVLVFTSLSESRGKFAGPGYWVMTPFVIETGGTVFVNRGFVPQTSGPQFAAPTTMPAGPVTLTGLALRPEASGPFTPGADAKNHLEWVRDPVRLAALVAPALAPFAGITIDLPAGEPGALPQGGETVVEFPNNHFGYALTWFGFALLTPALLVLWVWRQRQGAKPQKLAGTGPFQ